MAKIERLEKRLLRVREISESSPDIAMEDALLTSMFKNFESVGRPFGFRLLIVCCPLFDVFSLLQVEAIPPQKEHYGLHAMLCRHVIQVQLDRKPRRRLGKGLQLSVEYT